MYEKKTKRDNITLGQKLNSIYVWVHAKIETLFPKQQPQQKKETYQIGFYWSNIDFSYECKGSMRTDSDNSMMKNFLKAEKCYVV